MIPLLFAIGITMGAVGGILMKVGADHIGPVQIASFEQLASYLFRLFTDLTSLGGIALYFFSAVVWAYLLTKLDISLVQPILALTYVVTPILAIFLLNEHVSLMRWIGIAVIIVGVFIVARSSLMA